MSQLREQLDNYLALRRSLGYRLRRAEKLLAQFVGFCEQAEVDTVTVEVALAWATLPEAASPSWVCHRLGVVRAFSRHLALVDDAHQVIPTNLVPHRIRSRTAVTEPWTKQVPPTRAPSRPASCHLRSAWR